MAIKAGHSHKYSNSKLSETLSQQQKRELTEAFQRLDKDGDGVITAEELSVALQNLGFPASDDVISGMMREADFDGNGSVNLEEFLELNAIAESLESGMSRSVLQEVFTVFDTDRNGKISADELFRVMQSIEGGGVTIDECRRMISKVDMDGDGFVDFGEFEKMMRAPHVVDTIAC